MHRQQAVSAQRRAFPVVFAAASFLISSVSLFKQLPRTVQAQQINVGQAAPSGPRGHVQFAAEPQTIAAGKPTTLQLRFHVDPGFHINSHTPKSEMLIPTKIAVEDAPDMSVTGVDFPQGTLYSFSFEPKEKLDVYTGDVTLTVHLTAKPGAHTLKGALRYQACDSTACYPPKMLLVEQPFTAK